MKLSKNELKGIPLFIISGNRNIDNDIHKYKFPLHVHWNLSEFRESVISCIYLPIHKAQFIG